MSPLHTLLQKSARRIQCVRFLELLLQHLAILFAVTLPLLFLDKIGLLPLADWSRTGIRAQGHWQLPPLHMPALYLHTVLPLGALLALGVAALRLRPGRFSPTYAALALDQALDNRERLTTALGVQDSPRPLAAAVRDDAQTHAAGIDPRRVFPLRGGWGGPRLPWLVAGFLLLALLLPDMDLLGARERQREQAEAELLERQRLSDTADALKAAVEELKRMHPAGIDPDMEDLIRRMEELAETMKTDASFHAEQAQEEINRLQDQAIEKAREASRQDLQQLRDAHTPLDGRSPEDLFRDAVEQMQREDPGAAAEALARLRRELRKHMESPEAMQAMAEGMQGLGNDLDAMGEAADPELKRLTKEFEDLARELAKSMEGMQADALQEMREAMQNALQDAHAETPDLSLLTEEQRQLLAELQALLRDIERTEQELRDMRDMAQAGAIQPLTTEQLQQMLEQLKRQLQPCPTCNDSHSVPCPTCGGTGTDKDGNPCPDCDGTGNVPCPDCDGDCQGGGGGGCQTLVGIPGGGAGSRQSSEPSQGGGRGGSSYGTQLGGEVHGEQEHLVDGQTQDTLLRARAVGGGQIVGVRFRRGVAVEDPDLQTEYIEAVEAVEALPQTALEAEYLPREDREFIRRYNNAIKGIATDPQ